MNSPSYTLACFRRTATQNIKEKVNPFLHSSGFTNGNGGSLQLVVLKRKRKIHYPLSDSLAEGFMGFVAYGIVLDGFAGGLDTISYEQIPIEDLLKLERLTKRLTAESFKRG